MQLPAWLVVLGLVATGITTIGVIWTRGILPLARAVVIAQKLAPFLESFIDRRHDPGEKSIFEQVDELRETLTEIAEQVDELRTGTADLARSLGQLSRNVASDRGIYRPPGP